MLARFSAAEEAGDTAAMTDLMDKMRRELDVHTDIEETVFYPWARGLSEDIADVVDEGIQEHHVAKALLTAIGELDVNDEWIAKVEVLLENVERHANEDENELFPQIRSAADTDTLDGLAANLEAR